MSRTRVRPFAAGDVAAAGALLAQRHARHRVSRPLLSARYENLVAATAEVAAAFGTAGASGVFAVRGGEPVGYLLGFPKPGKLWGPNVWVESAVTPLRTGRRCVTCTLSQRPAGWRPG